MKIKTISGASLRITLVATVAISVCILVSFLIGPREWWWFLVLTLLCAGAIFFFSRWAIRKFFIYRVKPLYQVVLGRNIKTRELEKQMDKNPKVVETVSNELNRWAEHNQQEIARLKDNEKYRKEFVGNVSHEIKTPIFNIQGYISTLLDGGMNDPVTIRRYLERAEKSTDRLTNIANDLEKISQLESGVLNLQWEWFDIVELTREIVDTIEFEATKKGIKIIIGSDAPTPYPAIMVKADIHYIEQVLVNLIVNSIRYGTEGGTTYIKYIDLFDKILIEVSDNGMGISKEDIPRIFERFFRTDKSRSREQGGTGLGLSIVKHILEAHNEKISLRSELEKGSTFSFTLNKN